MKLNPADIWMSRCVRERASWTCEKCGLIFQPPTKALQAAHYITRGNWAVRFFPLNIFSLCAACHFKMDGNPYAFTEWVKGRLGVDLLDILIEKSNDLMRGKDARHSAKEITSHYKSEYERMMEVRATGIRGRIEFAEW